MAGSEQENTRSSDERYGPGKHEAFAAFQKAAEVEQLKKQQEFDRLFKTPQGREAGLEVKSKIAAQHEQNDEDLKDALKKVKDMYDPNRFIPPEVGRLINEENAKAYAAWEKGRKDIDELERQCLIDTALAHNPLEKKIGPKGPERQIEDNRSDLKRAWDDAGVRTQPAKAHITHEYNRVSGRTL